MSEPTQNVKPNVGRLLAAALPVAALALMRWFRLNPDPNSDLFWYVLYCLTYVTQIGGGMLVNLADHAVGWLPGWLVKGTPLEKPSAQPPAGGTS